MADIVASVSTSDKFAAHRVDHLFLLVGTNPLPNYVAARLLSREDCRFYLLASRGEAGTEGVAARLRKRLIADGFQEDRFQTVGVGDPSDRYKIHEAIKTFFDGTHAITPQGSVGLHYTGGTKPMAVHAYEYIKEQCAKTRRSFHYSYLDPRKLAFRFSEGDVDIRPDDLSLTLEKLLFMHGWEIAPGKAHFGSRIIACRIGESIGNFEELNAFRKSFENLDKTQLENMTLPSILMASSWDELFSISDLPDELRPVSKMKDYLYGGKWLEDYVAQCVESVGGEFQVTLQGTSVYVQRGGRSGKRTEDDTMFEFDVAAMRGYQLFVISCAISSDHKELKKKLFEVYTRARQIGGEEARVALVGGSDKTRALFDEIKEEWLEARGVIKVFGPQHYSDLSSELQDWFRQP